MWEVIMIYYICDVIIQCQVDRCVKRTSWNKVGDARLRYTYIKMFIYSCYKAFEEKYPTLH